MKIEPAKSKPTEEREGRNKEQFKGSLEFKVAENNLKNDQKNGQDKKWRQISMISKDHSNPAHVPDSRALNEQDKSVAQSVSILVLAILNSFPL